MERACCAPWFTGADAEPGLGKGIAEESAAYREMGLPTQQIDIRYRQLNKLGKHDVMDLLVQGLGHACHR